MAKSHAKDLERPGDNRRRAPAIPLHRREELLADVKAMEEGTLGRDALAKKYARYVSLTQPRTLRHWTDWAKTKLLARGWTPPAPPAEGDEAHGSEVPGGEA